MRTLLEEHGGAIATAAVIIAFIIAIVAFCSGDTLSGLFGDLMRYFSQAAQNAAGFGAPAVP